MGFKSEIAAMSHLKPLEQDAILAEIRQQLPDPIRGDRQLDGALVLIGGDPGEVVVHLSEGELKVSVFAVRWEGPHTPVVTPERLASLNWQRIPASRLTSVLHEVIAAAVELRSSTYRKCERCGEMNPPEWMHNENTCQSCAERHLGVVH